MNQSLKSSPTDSTVLKAKESKTIRQKLVKFATKNPLTRALDRITIRRFHKIIYNRNLWYTTHWMGHRIMQWPNDLIVKQEIIAATKPALLIECGTAHGGGALFYANLFDLLGGGQVLTIDIERYPDRPVHPRIEYFTGSSTDPATLDYVASKVAKVNGPVMVTLDSLHAAYHVSKELELYHRFVTPGCYLIVEDGEMNGHPVYTIFEPEIGPGPYEATMAFLPLHPEFKPDKKCERYLVTGHPNGYLRRK